MHCVRNYSFIVILFGILFSSCSKEKFEATVPAYISIDQITLSTDYANEGSNSSNISDAWVYVNDDLVGVFELPATFPVLKEGDVELKVYAGIKDNGITATRARYLLYDPHIEQVNLAKGQTIKVVPSVQYNKSAIFEWMEDFENASLSFLYHSNSDTTFYKQSSIVKEGSYSGLISLDDNMDFFEATSIAYSNLPRNGNPIYLEMDFKTNEQLLIGVYHNSTQYAAITLNTTDDWKKIYINLTDVIASNQQASDVKIFFGLQEFPNDLFLTSNPKIYIDNLKLVRY